MRNKEKKINLFGFTLGKSTNAFLLVTATCYALNDDFRCSTIIKSKQRPYDQIFPRFASYHEVIYDTTLQCSRDESRVHNIQ